MSYADAMVYPRTRRGSSRTLRVAGLATLLAAATLGLATVVGPQMDRAAAAARDAQYAAALNSAREWELQRRAQSPSVDPVLEHAREWERQRRAQSPDGG